MAAALMGNNGFVTAEEAGNILGVKTGEVHYLVRRGLLRPRYLRPRGKGAVFSPEEVSALAEVRERGRLDLRGVQNTAAQAFALARQLSRRVEFLESMLGYQSHPMPTDEEQVIALYARAQDEQQDPPETVAGILEWARLFVAMGEEFLDLVEAYTNDEAAWKVFMDLSEILLINAPIERFNFDKELEAAYGYLDVGRRNLRNVSFFYVRNRFGTRRANEMFDKASDCHANILAFATAQP
jgi:MerR-like DNA binding protein